MTFHIVSLPIRRTPSKDPSRPASMLAQAGGPKACRIEPVQIMHVRPHDRADDVIDRRNRVAVVVPVDRDVHEAEDAANDSPSRQCSTCLETLECMGKHTPRRSCCSGQCCDSGMSELARRDACVRVCSPATRGDVTEQLALNPRSALLSVGCADLLHRPLSQGSPGGQGSLVRLAIKRIGTRSLLETGGFRPPTTLSVKSQFVAVSLAFR